MSYYKMNHSIAQSYNDWGTDEGEAQRLQFPTPLSCGAEGTDLDFEETNLSPTCDDVTGVEVLGSRRLRAMPTLSLDGLVTDLSSSPWCTGLTGKMSWSIIGEMAQQKRIAGIMANNRRDRVLSLIALGDA